MSQGSGSEPSSGKRLAGIQAKIGKPANLKFDRAENRDKILAGSFLLWLRPRRVCKGTYGLVAMTPASHAEGRQLDPGQVYFSAWKGHPRVGGNRSHIPGAARAWEVLHS